KRARDAPVENLMQSPVEAAAVHLGQALLRRGGRFFRVVEQTKRRLPREDEVKEPESQHFAVVVSEFPGEKILQSHVSLDPDTGCGYDAAKLRSLSAAADVFVLAPAVPRASEQACRVAGVQGAAELIAALNDLSLDRCEVVEPHVG